MVIIDGVINTLLGGQTLDPAGMHCPSWDDAFVSSFVFLVTFNVFNVFNFSFYAISCIMSCRQCLCQRYCSYATVVQCIFTTINELRMSTYQ